MLASLAAPALGSLGSLGDEPPPVLTCPAGKYPMFGKDGRLLGCFADPAEQPPPVPLTPPWKPSLALLLGGTALAILSMAYFFRKTP